MKDAVRSCHITGYLWYNWVCLKLRMILTPKKKSYKESDLTAFLIVDHCLFERDHSGLALPSVINLDLNFFH